MEEEPEQQPKEEEIEELGVSYKHKTTAIKRLEDNATHFVSGLSLNLPWCKACKFNEFLELIEFQNWTYLLSECFNKPLYADALKDFHASFSCEKGKIT